MSEADAKSTAGDPPLFQAALITFTALLVVLAVLFGADWLLRADSFPVRNVRFEGEFHHVTQAELEAAVRGVVHRNFLTVDLDAIKAKVEGIPWVYSASVSRYWPRDVYVRFTEQHPVARWGADAWVNEQGQVIHVQADDLPSDAVQLAGPDGTSAEVLNEYHLLEPVLERAKLDIRTLTLTPRRTWRVDLAAGPTLVLDRDDPQQKIERFVEVYPQTLAPQLARIRQVDLRYTNGFAVQWADVRSMPAELPTHAAKPVARAGDTREG
jgi:cell division protein FtsQ